MHSSSVKKKGELGVVAPTDSKEGPQKMVPRKGHRGSTRIGLSVGTAATLKSEMMVIVGLLSSVTDLDLTLSLGSVL